MFLGYTTHFLHLSHLSVYVDGYHGFGAVRLLYLLLQLVHVYSVRVAAHVDEDGVRA